MPSMEGKARHLPLQLWGKVLSFLGHKEPGAAPRGRQVASLSPHQALQQVGEDVAVPLDLILHHLLLDAVPEAVVFELEECPEDGPVVKGTKKDNDHDHGPKSKFLSEPQIFCISHLAALTNKVHMLQL